MADTPVADDDLNRLPTDEELGLLQFTTVLYYLHETNPDNGLVRDKTDPNAPVSIAAVGMALATIPVVVERGVIIREFAAKITRKTTALLARMPAGSRAGRLRLQGLLLPFPGHRNRSPRLAVRALHHRLGVPVRRRVDGRHLFRPRHRRRGRDPQPGRCALPPGRLELGRDGGPTLTHGWRPETGFIPHRWQGYDEGLAALHPRPRFADASVAAGELSRLLRDLPVEEHLRSRIALLGPALHASALAHVDRLSRHPRRIHAGSTAATISKTAGKRPLCSRSTRSAIR